MLFSSAKILKLMRKIYLAVSESFDPECAFFHVKSLESSRARLFGNRNTLPEIAKFLKSFREIQ